MIEKIFEYEKIATNAVLVVLLFIVLFIIVFFIRNFLIKRLKKKKSKQEKIIAEANEIVSKKNEEMLMVQEKSSNESDKTSALKEINKNNSKLTFVKGIANNEIDKLDNKIERVEKLDYIKLFFSIIIIGAFCVIISIVPKIGGRVSNLNKMDYENQNIRLNAYYTVSYSGTDQITITLYVKNNSEKSLKSATVMQKGTGSVAKITNLDAGEEKILSLNSYKGDEYEFEIQEIVFNE